MSSTATTHNNQSTTVPSSEVHAVRRLASANELAVQTGVPYGGVRWDLHNAAKNGLEASGAILRRGRRVLIDPVIYSQWLMEGGRRKHTGKLGDPSRAAEMTALRNELDAHNREIRDLREQIASLSVAVTQLHAEPSMEDEATANAPSANRSTEQR